MSPPPSSPSPNDGHTLQVRLGRVESVDLYEIKDSELEQLEKGTQGDLHSTSATFLISCTLSCGLALATAEFRSPKVETFFMLMTLVGTLGGIYQAILWWKSKSAIKALCDRIKNRITPVQAAAYAATAPGDVACAVVADEGAMAVGVVVPRPTPEPTQPAG